MLKTITLPATTSDVGELISSQLVEEQLEHCKCFLKLLLNDSDESDSNFVQLINLCCEDDAKLSNWIKQKKNSIHAEMQNKMVKVMALHVL